MKGTSNYWCNSWCSKPVHQQATCKRAADWLKKCKIFYILFWTGGTIIDTDGLHKVGFYSTKDKEGITVTILWSFRENTNSEVMSSPKMAN